MASALCHGTELVQQDVSSGEEVVVLDLVETSRAVTHVALGRTPQVYQVEKPA